MEINVPGIGDVTDKLYGQASTAAGDGVKASNGLKYLQKNK